MISNFLVTLLVSNKGMFFILVTYTIIYLEEGLEVICEKFVGNTPSSGVRNQSYLGPLGDVKVRLIWRPRPYLCLLFFPPFVVQYQRLNRLSDVYEVRYKSSLKKVVEKHEFHENWLSDRRTILGGVNRFPCFTNFVSDLDEIRGRICSHNAIEQSRVSWALAQGEPHLA